MVKVYAVSLALGIAGLIVLVYGDAFAESIGRPHLAPGRRIGIVGKAVVGAVVGFGMGGMSSEFSPLDLRWEVSLLIALVAAALSVFWVRYAVRQAER